jgi:hypothetical protein
MNSPSHESMADLARALGEDPEYRRAFTAKLAAREVDQKIVEQFIAYARARQTTRGQATARQVLTEAGVSWESL